MAIQFQRLATPGEGVSTLLDFAPLAASIRNYQDNEKAALIGNAARTGGNTAAAAEAMKQGQLDTGAQYQRLANQDSDRAQANKDRQIKMLGGVAQAAKYEKDPARRALIWQTGLKRAGVNPQDLDPDELDPMTGPDVFLAASGMAQDPRESQLMDLKLAQANKTLSEPSERNRVGLQPIYGRDAQGNIVIMQPSSSGELVQARTPQGVTVDPGLVTGQKELAKAQSQASVALPRAQAIVEQTRDVITKLRNHPGRAEATGYGALLPDVAFTNRAGKGFIDLFNQAQGGAFLQAFEMLKGGGPITEIEGTKATQAMNRMSRAAKKEDFDAALDDYLTAVETGYKKLEQKAGGMGTAPASNGPPPGEYVYNPATGKVERK